MPSVIIVGAVIGVTEFIKRLLPTLPGWVTIVIAAAIGLLAGLAHIDGTDWLSGILAGLAAVGVHTTATAISK